MEGGVATVCFATGMAAIGAIMLALLARGRPRRREPVPVRQHEQPARRRSRRTARDVTFVDATDAAEVERGADAGDAARVRRDDRQSAHAGRRPRGASARCAARAGILYVVDNTMTSPWLFRPKTVGASLVVNALTKYIGGHGNALGGSVTDTGLFDWTRFPTSPTPTRARTRGSGASRRSARRACATGAARCRPSRRTTSRSARRRSRCAWSASARTRWRSPAASRRTRACARSTIRGCRTHPQHALRAGRCSAPPARCCRSSSPTASTASSS